MGGDDGNTVEVRVGGIEANEVADRVPWRRAGCGEVAFFALVVQPLAVVADLLRTCFNVSLVHASVLLAVGAGGVVDLGLLRATLAGKKHRARACF